LPHCGTYFLPFFILSPALFYFIFFQNPVFSHPRLPFLLELIQNLVIDPVFFTTFQN